MSCRSSPSRNKNTLLNIYVSHLATIQNYIFFLKTQRKYGVLLADTRENAPRDCHVGRCPPRNDIIYSSPPQALACIFGGIAQSATPPASKDNIFRLTPYPHKKTLRHALTSSPPSNKKKPASPGRNGSSVI